MAAEGWQVPLPQASLPTAAGKDFWEPPHFSGEGSDWLRKF